MTKEEFKEIKRLELELNEAHRFIAMLDSRGITISNTKFRKHPIMIGRGSPFFEPIRRVVAERMEKLQYQFDQLKVSSND